MKQTFSIKIAGAAGQGIKTTGLLLAKAAKLAGYHTFAYTEYPSLIRGGHNIFQIELSTNSVTSPSMKIDAVIALNKESALMHLSEIADGGFVIYDNVSCNLTDAEKNTKPSVHMLDIPIRQVTKDIGAKIVMENSTALGALWAVLNLDITILDQEIERMFQSKQQVIDINKLACKAGYDAASKQEFRISLPPVQPEAIDMILITGNEAVALGTIASGVRLYSGYPMTPSTSILHYLAGKAEQTGMLVKQADDEITAVQMVLGASFAGTRAMTGTSGGGFALMAESVGFAAISEIPLVIVVSQRTGPATGMPTWTEQSDLQFVVHSAPGEFIRMAVAPGDPTEAYELVAQAHNFAEKYQIPVIILLDKHLSESYYIVDKFDNNKINIERGNIALSNELDSVENFLRYKVEEKGVSKRSLPGQKGGIYLANSDEHTEKGYSTEDFEIRTMMVDKRKAKLPYIMDDIPEPLVYGFEDAEITLVAWGSSKGPVLDAINILAKENIHINMLHYKYVFPVKTSKLSELINRGQRLINIENNSTGQFATLIKEQIGFEFSENLLKYDGRQFFPEELAELIKERL